MALPRSDEAQFTCSNRKFQQIRRVWICEAHHPRVFFAAPKKSPRSIYMFSRETLNKYFGYKHVSPANLLWLLRSSQAQFICSHKKLSTNTLDLDRSSLPTLWLLLWFPRSSQARFTCSHEKLSTNTLDIDMSSLPTSWFPCGS